MKIKPTISFFIAMFMCHATYAETTNMAIGAKLSPLGAGVEAYVPVTPSFTARIGYNTFSYNHEQSLDGIDYDVDLHLQTVFLNSDWHPFGGGFRLTAAAVVNGNKINGSGTPEQDLSFNIGDTNYSSKNIRADASVTFKSFAPYLGIGWDNIAKTRKGFGFSTELGVIFQGEPEVNYNVVDLNEGQFLAEEREQLNQDIEKEIELIKDDISVYQFFPVLSLGITYQF